MEDIKLARDLYETYPGPCKLNDCSGCKYFNYDNICLQLKQAESLIARGYHKVKWHKISEGDLPRNQARVLVYYVENNYEFYNICVYDCFNHRGFYRINAWGDTKTVDAIAWMEIPKYLEF